MNNDVSEDGADYIGKFSFVNRTIAERNQIPEGAIGTSPLKRIHLGRECEKYKSGS
jgi:hypothetical protein